MKKSRSTSRTKSGRRVWGRAQSPARSARSPKKAQAGVVCPGCGAVWSAGRWRWAEAPAGAAAKHCDACRRIGEGRAAGLLVLEGAFLARHKDDILALARNQEAIENREHPLNRIMSVEEGAGRIEIATTDAHLPRRIGRAIERAFGGKLALRVGEGDTRVRANWRREN